MGAVNLHPSLLPDYRGRAPINWAILRGESRLGLTAHRVDQGVDTGPILQQCEYTLGVDEDVGDALGKLLPLYRKITADVLAQFGAGVPMGCPQLAASAATWPARKAEHGEIDWQMPAAQVRDLVRAVARPYPGAFTFLLGRKLLVWRAHVREDATITRPGTVISIDDDHVLVQCGSDALEISDMEGEGSPAVLYAGSRLGRGVDEERDTLLHYEDLYALHGDSHDALNWGSQAGQRQRFQVLAGIGALDGKRVLDVGCGLAHFADWIHEQGAAVEYTGLDLVPSLIEGARRRRPELRLLQGSILDPSRLTDEHFDYVFASGIFYTYSDGAQETLQAMVYRMWYLAKCGVAFNALGTHAPDQVPGEYYADPDAVLRFCRRLSPRAQLVIGYHPRDFTVYLHRDAP